ncbi:hypothetical protein [Pseudoalteromonas phenolica]|uniref:hypothetical protein n=1 Tax=Pseudoalteromonas phenolica TaxID=161398 RepID=UPI00384EEB8D
MAVYDEHQKALYLIRDHFGVHPLFVTENKGFLAFSSNKAALLALPWVEKSINEQWLADNMTQTFIDRSATFYLNIKSHLAAHWRLISAGQDNMHRYWELDLSYSLPIMSEEEYISQFNTLFLKR